MYPIPANATRIRYLESTGTQYIDTGVLFGEMDVRARVNFMYWSTPGGGTKMILASGVGSNRGFVISTAFSNGAQAWNLGIGANNFGGSVVGNTWYDVQASIRSAGSTLTVDGTTVVSSSAYSNFNGVSLFIFARNNNGTADLLDVSAPARVASLDISVSGTLVRSYVPLRVGQVGYLFDRVSGQLFGNAADNNAGFPAECLGPDTFAQGVVPTRMMAMGVRKKKVWPVPLYTGVSLVGSSVQNNNGILSGFTSSSYATMPWLMTAGATSLEACIKFHWNGATSTNGGIWGCVGTKNSFTPFYYEVINANHYFGSYLSSNGTSWAVTPNGGHWSPQYPAAGDYILKFSWKNGTATYSRWTGSLWVADATASISSIYGGSGLVPQLGTNRGQNYPLNGTIDLNYTYLMRDGELWWEGASGAYRNVKTTYPD